MTLDSYRLRAATLEDEPLIKSLIRQTRLNPLGLRWHQFVVAVDDAGQLIGCGQVKPHRDGSRELASLLVLKPYRRQGIARAIIHRLEEMHGFPLWLTCASPLVPFYESFGYSEVLNTRELPRYFRIVKWIANILFPLTDRSIRLAVMVREE